MKIGYARCSTDEILQTVVRWVAVQVAGMTAIWQCADEGEQDQ